MKRILPLILAIFIPCLSFGASEYDRTGTGFSIIASTSAWTLVTSTASFPLPNRSAVIVSNGSGVDDTAVLPINKNQANNYPITYRPIVIPAGEYRELKFGFGIELYLLSLHTATQTVHILEIK